MGRVTRFMCVLKDQPSRPNHNNIVVTFYRILDWEYFTVGNDSYLIGSNQRPTGDGDKFKDTIIYRWKGAEKFVPAHKIQTDASADWEAIYDGMDTYLIYANGGGRTTEIYKAKLR